MNTQDILKKIEAREEYTFDTESAASSIEILAQELAGRDEIDVARMLLMFIDNGGKSTLEAVILLADVSQA